MVVVLVVISLAICIVVSVMQWSRVCPSVYLSAHWSMNSWLTVGSTCHGQSNVSAHCPKANTLVTSCRPTDRCLTIGTSLQPVLDSAVNVLCYINFHFHSCTYFIGLWFGLLNVVDERCGMMQQCLFSTRWTLLWTMRRSRQQWFREPAATCTPSRSWLENVAPLVAATVKTSAQAITVHSPSETAQYLLTAEEDSAIRCLDWLWWMTLLLLVSTPS